MCTELRLSAHSSSAGLSNDGGTVSQRNSRQASDAAAVDQLWLKCPVMPPGGDQKQSNLWGLLKVA